MTDWNERILESTRGRVIQLVRRGETTVNELASALELTDNAIRAHLTSLERDGLIRQARKRPGTRKPETVYALTPQAEQLFPKAYHILLDLLLDELSEKLSSEELEEILRKIGRRLAVDARRPSNVEEGLQNGLETLKQLGGLAEIVVENGKSRICGFSCPLSSVVKNHPQICHLAAALLTEVVGAPIKNVCERDHHPRCVFELS